MEIFTRCPAEWKGSTKDTNRNSSGTPFVYSSVPCYLQGMHFLLPHGRSSVVLMCSLCCSFFVDLFFFIANMTTNPTLGANARSSFPDKLGSDGVMKPEVQSDLQLTLQNQCLVVLPLSRGRRGVDQCVEHWLQGLRSAGGCSFNFRGDGLLVS